jgi:hypothetical protein
VQGLADEDVGPDTAVTAAVEVGGVDVVHAELDGAAQHGAARLGVAGCAVDATLGGQPHGAEAEPADGEVAAEAEVACHGSRLLRFGTGRKLWPLVASPAVLVSERSREHLREVADRGAQVRIAATPLPQETIIIDRRIAILTGPDTLGDREYTVTTAPTLIGGVCALFEAAWETATDIATYLGPDPSRLDIQSRAILRALGSGVTDQAAARKLGLSLRTYRRRVADLLDTLDANSRFQAGLRAGELGLTR